MILALDFGSATIKAVLISDEPGSSRVFSFNLGLRAPAVSRASLRVAVQRVELLSGEKILEGDKPLVKIYACVGLPVYESSPLLCNPIILTSTALSTLSMNVLDIGAQFVYFQERVSASPVKAEDVLTWLPFKVDIGDVSSYIENKSIYSSVLPATARDLYLEQAMARVRVSNFFESQKIETSLPEVYLSGAVYSKVPYTEQAVLMILDSLQPRQPMKIFLDRSQILPVAGLVKFYSQEDFIRIGDQFIPICLGTLVPLPRSCEVRIDSRLRDPQTVSLHLGDLYNFPLDFGEMATITVVKDERGRNGQTFEVTGGQIGLVFDLRERPLKIPESESGRQALLKSWDRVLGASGQIEKI